MNAVMFQTMWDTLAELKYKLISMDNVTSMIAGQILPMDEETTEQLVKKMTKLVEKGGKYCGTTRNKENNQAIKEKRD